jgi:hypothetical protein
MTTITIENGINVQDELHSYQEKNLFAVKFTFITGNGIVPAGYYGAILQGTLLYTKSKKEADRLYKSINPNEDYCVTLSSGNRILSSK